MSEECTHDCSSCSASCGERQDPQDFMKKPHELSCIRKVIGVVSGKGGVGKSMVTSLLAAAAKKKGLNPAILDADITGPSIPKAFGIKEKAQGDNLGIYPVCSDSGIPVMSVNLLLENDTDPVIWRGPVVGGVVEQFWTDVIWNDIDVMFIDMPPGTGDVPLTVFQSIPVDGIVIVTSPQDLVSMIVGKAVNMAKAMDIPVLGIIENLSYFKCPDCGKEHHIFGESHIDEVAESFDIPLIANLPVDPAVASLADQGKIEEADGEVAGTIGVFLDELMESFQPPQIDLSQCQEREVSHTDDKENNL